MKAVPGLFVLFPSWLQHYVPAHEGLAPRLSVSFNVRLTFPPTPEGDSFVGGAGGGAGEPTKLTFTVPEHHQQGFLEKGLARDMHVS